MKAVALVFFLFQVSCLAWADVIPVIVTQPQSQSVPISSDITLTVTSTNATGFQWRFNGVNISGATNSILQVTNAQAINSGYYVVIVKNPAGWTPSQMAYVSVTLYPTITTGLLPLSDFGNVGSQVRDGSTGQPLNNGVAHVAFGAQLDQLKLFSLAIPVTNGYFKFTGGVHVTDILPGQNVYYAAYINYTNANGSSIFQSTVLSLPTGASLPSISNLKFPGWPEWPEPQFLPNPVFEPTNLIQVPGESLTFSNTFFAYFDFGKPTIQWRKDGVPIPHATNALLASGSIGGACQSSFTITNFQANDAGIYDVEIFGNNWIVSPKVTVSVQITNGPGVFQSPRFAGSNFVSDLIGVPTRNYAVQWSSNLSTWNDLVIVSNSTGTVTFTNSLDSSSTKFYRSKLLP